MKKVTFLLATLLIGGMMLTGCKKKTDPTPEPEPTPTTYTVEYTVLNKDLVGHTMSDCFKLDVTYTNAKGESVTETNLTLPWVKSIEVEAPFHAEMSGTFTYNENELPETVSFGHYLGIVISCSGNTYYFNNVSGGINPLNKEKFLQVYGNDPDKLKFTSKKDF